MSAEIKAMLSELIDTTCANVEILDHLFDIPGADEMTRYQAEALSDAQESLRAAYVALKAARAEFP